MLRGQVVDADGNPVSEALVVLVELNEQQEPKGGGRRTPTWSGPEGRFALGLPTWVGDRGVLLVARASEWQPSSQVIGLDANTLRRPHTLVLGHGLEITGQVRKDGRPLEGAEVSIDRRYGESGVFGAGEEGWWENGRLENKQGWCKTDSNGTFRIKGMGSGEFRLDVNPPQGLVPSTVKHTFSARPGEFQIYDLSEAYLSLLVVDGAGPVEGAWVHVTGEAKRLGFKSGVEPTRIGVAALGSIHLDVLGRGYKPRTMEAFQTPELGETRECIIEIERELRPSLVVRVPGANQAGVDWVSLNFHRGLLGAVQVGPALEALHLQRDSGQDTFHAPVVDLDPDVYLLVLGSSSQGGASACVATRAVPVQVPPAGEFSVELELELWARFSVQVDLGEPSGGPKTIRRRLLDTTGRVLMERSTEYFNALDEDFPGGSWVEEFSMSSSMGDREFGWRFNGAWQPTGAAPPIRWGLVPAGAYTLQVEATGYETGTRSVTLVAGEENTLSIQLTTQSEK